MTDKWIGPRRVLCGDSNPPPDGYEYVRRYADDVRLAAGAGTTVENENVAGYVAFRRDWMRRRGLRNERCSLVDVTGDSMEPELFDGDSALVDHSRCDPVEGEIFALRTVEGPLVKRLRFHDDRWWASSDNDSSENGSRPLDGDDGGGRVAPGDCSPEALTRSGQGDFHHPAPPLMCLVATPPISARQPAAGEAGSVPGVCRTAPT